MQWNVNPGVCCRQFPMIPPRHLHTMGMLVRDLKTDNVVLSDEGNIRIWKMLKGWKGTTLPKTNIHSP